MIPKMIHYCWFGKKPLSPLAIKCIESWKKYFPDYEIKEWNEENFDVNKIPYTQEAYKVKKYAFVSDYARFWILYHYGGLYFDTDVEVIKPFNDIVSKGAFMGCENVTQIGATTLAVNPGLGLGCTSGLSFYKKMLDVYDRLHFVKDDGTLNLKTIVEYTSELFKNCGLKNVDEIQQVENIWIYPKEYFNPKDFYTGKIQISANTCTIHHFAMSWVDKKERRLSDIKRFLMRIFGTKNVEWIISTLKLKEFRNRIRK